MGPFVRQLLLESVLVPFVLASLLVLPTRWPSRFAIAPVTALALLAALGGAYLLIVGWPALPPVGARQKILYSAIIGMSTGMVMDRNWSWSARLSAATSILIPVWIGWSSIAAAQPKAIVLLMPMAVGLWMTHHIDRTRPATVRSTIMLITLAIGLGVIAVSARTISLAALGLALAAALGGILLVGSRPPAVVAPIAATTFLVALAAALSVYSTANVLALGALVLVLAADPLITHFGHTWSTMRQRLLFGVFCLIPALVALSIVQIDGGINPLY